MERVVAVPFPDEAVFFLSSVGPALREWNIAGAYGLTRDFPQFLVDYWPVPDIWMGLQKSIHLFHIEFDTAARCAVGESLPVMHSFVARRET